MLEHLGLVSALTELSTTFARVSGVRVERQFDPSLPKLAPDDRARRLPHRAGEPDERRPPRAGATGSTITLERGHDSVVLRVVDDGRGFDGAPEEHGGLRSMRERALLSTARWRSSQRAGGGVEVRLEVPAAPRRAGGGAR